MAGTTTSSRRTTREGSDVDDGLKNLNKAVDDVEALRTALYAASLLVNEMRTNYATMKAAFDNLRLLELNALMVSGAVATGTTTSKIKIVTATTTFLIDGVFKSKAATDDFWVLGAAGANTVVPTGNTQKYYLFIDAAGASSVLEGTYAATAGAVVAPALPASKCLVAVATVANASAGDFTPGTTLLGAAGITTTYVNGYDTSVAPAGPAALTQPAVTTAPIDNATDMTAAKIGNSSGTAIS